MNPLLSRLGAWYSQGGRTVQLGLVLVFTQLGLRLWQLLPGAYWQDDFRYLQTARSLGLTADFLFQDYHGHLMPAGFLLNWVVAQFPGSFVPAVVAILAMQAATSFMLLALLRRLLGTSPGVLVGLALFLYTPLALASGLWWAAATQSIPLQLALCLSGYAHLRYLESGRRGWLLVSFLGFVLGLSFWEKAVLIPGFLVLLTWLREADSWKSALRTTRRLWRVWAVYAAAGGCYLGWYLTNASDDGASIESFGQLVTVVRYAVVDTFLVGLIGGPWSGTGFFPTGYPQPSGLVVAVALAAAALALAWGFRMRRHSIWVVLAALGLYLGADVALLAWARGYWGGFLARDPRYIADALPITALAVSFMFTPGGEDDGPRSGSPLRDRSRIVAPLVAVALVASCLVTAAILVPPLQHRDVSAYIANARAVVDADEGLVLYDGPVPEALMLHTFGEPAVVSTVLQAYDIHPRYNITSQRMRILDDSGDPRPIQLVFEQKVTPTEVAGCGLALDGGERRELTLGVGVGVGRWVMRIDYYAADSALATVTVGDTRLPFRFSSGLNSVYFPVEGPFPSALVENRGHSTVCVASISVGLPVPQG